MKIIDFEKKGNAVRFYLGKKTEEWGWTNPIYKGDDGKTPDWLKPQDTYYGDDWDDTPYEHNAGRVYDEFIKDTVDKLFDFDDLVLEPCDGTDNSRWSKEDMVNRKVPCIIVVPKEIVADSWRRDFAYWLGVDGIKRYYFGDDYICESLKAPNVKIFCQSNDAKKKTVIDDKYFFDQKSVWRQIEEYLKEHPNEYVNYISDPSDGNYESGVWVAFKTRKEKSFYEK